MRGQIAYARRESEKSIRISNINHKHPLQDYIEGCYCQAISLDKFLTSIFLAGNLVFSCGNISFRGPDVLLLLDDHLLADWPTES